LKVSFNSEVFEINEELIKLYAVGLYGLRLINPVF
jgi:hypothetical protein